MTAHHPSLVSPSCKDHLLLLYEDENKLDEEAAHIMNEALKHGRLCIYASVHVSDRDHMSRISEKIPDFEKHRQEGDLVVVDFAPFYDGMLQGDLTLFRQLKQDLEEMVHSRGKLGRSASAIMIADCAGLLSKNKHFDRSVTLEDWWHETHLDWQRDGVDIAVICPHPASVLKQAEFSHDLAKLSRAHSLTLDMIKSRSVDSNALQNTVSALPISSRHAPIRILVVEPEPDIKALYYRYLNYQGIALTAASDGGECLKYINGNGRHEGSAFDMVILDWHLHDISAESIVKKIREKVSDQQIIVTGTDLDGKRKELGAIGIEVLEKPFRFSELLSLIKPAEPKFK